MEIIFSWRDRNNKEVDLIIKLHLLKEKSSQLVFDGLLELVKSETASLLHATVSLIDNKRGFVEDYHSLFHFWYIFCCVRILS